MHSTFSLTRTPSSICLYLFVLFGFVLLSLLLPRLFLYHTLWHVCLVMRNQIIVVYTLTRSLARSLTYTQKYASLSAQCTWLAHKRQIVCFMPFLWWLAWRHNFRFFRFFFAILFYFPFNLLCQYLSATTAWLFFSRSVIFALIQPTSQPGWLLVLVRACLCVCALCCKLHWVVVTILRERGALCRCRSLFFLKKSAGSFFANTQIHAMHTTRIIHVIRKG